MEGLIASVLLAGSTLGIGAAMNAAHTHETHSSLRNAAMLAGRQLLDEVAALPMTATGTEPSMATFNNYSDVATTDASGSVVAARVSSSTGSYKAGSTASGTDSVSLGNVVTSVLPSTTSLTTAISSTGTTSSGVTVSTSAPVRKVKRSLTVTRKTAIDGSTSTTGDFAILKLTVTTSDGTIVTLKRLVTAAETDGNRS